MRILVLAGTGAMGNYLVHLLAEQGHEVDVTSRREMSADLPGIRFIQGNAAEDDFLREILQGERYDAVVDFLNYATAAFEKRVELLLDATGQYVFLSSGRVYADVDRPITEDDARLLDSCTDEAYLQTDEYALKKARQEDLLLRSGKRNWTIVRPYITYSDNRLQLGFQEKELWLYRVLHGRTLLFFRDLAEKTTTMTWGQDVAAGIAGLIGNEKAIGQAFNMAQSSTMTWGEVLALYVEVIERETGVRPKVKLIDSSEKLAAISNRQPQRRYDRLYNRVIDHSKATQLCPGLENAAAMREGLSLCLSEFLHGRQSFGPIEWKAEGYMDKLTHDFTPLSEIQGKRNKARYLAARFTRRYER